MEMETELNLKYRLSKTRMEIFNSLKHLEEEAGCKVTGLEYDGGKIKILCEMQDANVLYKITSAISEA